jgi:hypothetical protein
MEKVSDIGAPMPRQEALQWIDRYQNEHGKDVKRGFLLGSKIILEALNQPGAEGIWFFKGINNENEEKLIILPADAEGNFLQGASQNKESRSANGPDDDGFSADASQDCPTNCPKGLGG